MPESSGFGDRLDRKSIGHSGAVGIQIKKLLTSPSLQERKDIIKESVVKLSVKRKYTLMEAVYKVVMEVRGLIRRLFILNKITRGHNPEGIEVELVDVDLEKMGHLYIKVEDGKPEITSDLISEQKYSNPLELVGSTLGTRDDNRIFG